MLGLAPTRAPFVRRCPDFDIYFRPALEMGAGVSSNSWGSNDVTTNYVDTDRETDLFSWYNQEMLIVVASGNTGRRGGILSPGSSKNALRCCPCLCGGAAAPAM